MSSRGVHRGENASTTERLNGSANGNTYGTINSSPTTDLKTNESMSRTKDALLQSIPVPEVATSSNVFRTTLLLLYFGTCVYV